MVAKSVQSKNLLIRGHFGRSYPERGMGIPHGVYQPWLGDFCYLNLGTLSTKTVQSFMKNLIRIGVFAFGIFIFQASVAHATDYNYLPADVGIKQKESLSALEYRLQSLESQLSNNPSTSSSNISARISELQSERDVEINYIRGLYAQNGISNQADAKVAEITAKYVSQISALESQKSSYQSQSDMQAKEAEITELKLKIKQLEYDMQNSEYEKTTETQKSSATIYDLYDWLETLPPEEWSAKLNLLRSMNPENYKKIEDIYRLRHPEFFTQTNETITPKIVPNAVVQKKTEVIKKAEPKQELKVEATTTPTAQVPMIKEVKLPEPPKETFVQKIFGFLKKLIFWK